MLNDLKARYYACLRPGRGLLKVMVLTAFAIPSANAQVPPPPPLPGQAEVAMKLARSLAEKDLGDYASLLASDLQVIEDGKTIAHNKSEWLGRFGPKLTARGVTFKIISGYASTGRILMIEYFNSTASWGDGPPSDCCWGYDAVAYDVSEGKVRSISRLRGGTVSLDETGKPQKPD